ncbi:hypothetical protein CTAYLR_000538 [Chrysophaeum taylorii]|uniref:arginine--tRNA ligase n=1 Tax=Chrysophaeum taylorii TaxID=2483200 RepID=A0AAD7UH11_9STRA|nr:hypothetical protein CTAYLR_000538 [Chrysophaeum taylorii]
MLVLLGCATALQIRSASPRDEFKIRLTLARELMNPLFFSPEHFLVADNGKKNIVGFAQLRPIDDFEELASVYVDESFRGKGLGSDLVKTLLERATTDVYLLTLEKTTPFYERFGFEPSDPPGPLAIEKAIGDCIASAFLNGTSVVCMRRTSLLPCLARALVTTTTTTTTRSTHMRLAPGGDAREFLSERVAAALGDEFGSEFASRSVAAVTVATKSEFGDYQCNAALGLAKRVGCKPRDIASRVAARLPTDVFGIEVAGPGFINVRLTDDFLAQTVSALAGGAVPQTQTPQRIVVDYSSPNIAKEMHVGHLRSTVVGDAIANCLELRGHDVVRQNHVGDWGTQFGMLLAHVEDEEWESVSDLVGFYREAKRRFDSDDEFKSRAREKVVRLQAGDVETRGAWERICALSRIEFDEIYARLGIRIEERGESTYQSMLRGVVRSLRDKGIAVESDGAIIVPGDPLIIQKSDGGFNYATTDLAAAAYRTRRLNATRLLYVTDAGQARHFKEVFRVAKEAGLVPPNTELEHVPFGLVQGEDGKKFKTRSGETVRLKDLLDEAEARAAERNPDAAREIGIGAVKYADLSLNRESNYKFSFDKMLSLTGNTAPYMLYSYARINGIQSKLLDDDVVRGDFRITEPEERNLARLLARLAPTLADLESDLRPNILCDFLFDLSQTFNRFYEVCPVAQADDADQKFTRATLCAATASVLKTGLDILGIQTVDRL